MLTARRDPPFHADASDRSRPTHNIDLMTRHGASSHGRFMTGLQLIGSILAIPLGLASGYSIYYSNFSTQAQCQNLRSNIVSMLDKNADATTLRMLVRRDVAMFETTCGSVDPEAVAAFKNLLASAHPAAPAHPALPPQKVAHEHRTRPLHETAKPAPAKAVEANPARVKAVETKPVPAKAVEAKPVPPKATEMKPAPPKAAEAKPEQDAAGISDAKWVASVRDALIHAPEPQAETADTVEAPASTPVQAAAPARAEREASAPVPSPAPPPAPAVAPALPPAASIAAAPVPASPADHPVPPAAIPDSVPTPAAETEKPAPSGIRRAIAEIPLLGRLAK